MGQLQRLALYLDFFYFGCCLRLDLKLIMLHADDFRKQRLSIAHTIVLEKHLQVIRCQLFDIDLCEDCSDFGLFLLEDLGLFFFISQFFRWRIVAVCRQLWRRELGDYYYGRRRWLNRRYNWFWDSE